MYRESMANGFAATLLFLVFLFLLARHIRKLRVARQQPTLPETVRDANSNGLPPPYATMPPPPSYQEAVKMGAAPQKY